MAKLSTSPSLKLIAVVLAFIIFVIAMNSSSDEVIVDDNSADTISTSNSNVAMQDTDNESVAAIAAKQTMDTENIRALQNEQGKLLEAINELKDSVSNQRTANDEIDVDAMLEAKLVSRLESYEKRIEELTQSSISNKELPNIDDVIGSLEQSEVGLTFEEISDGSDTEIVWITPVGHAISEEGVLEGLSGAFDGFSKDVSPIETSPEKRRIKYATIDADATLHNALLMSSIVGVVPKDGVVSAYYPFRVVLSKENIASNGLVMPHIERMTLSGIASGNWSMSCVKASITSATFIFDDGTISTSTSKSGDGEQGALAVLSDPYGNTCINGKQVSNFSEYLTIQTGLGTLAGAAEGLSAAQTLITNGGDNGITSSVVGDISEYALGKGAVKGVSTSAETINKRYENHFDAIVIDPNDTSTSELVSVFLSQAIAIDYDPEGRKVIHEDFEEKRNEYFSR